MHVILPEMANLSETFRASVGWINHLLGGPKVVVSGEDYSFRLKLANGEIVDARSVDIHHGLLPLTGRIEDLGALTAQNTLLISKNRLPEVKQLLRRHAFPPELVPLAQALLDVSE